MRNHSTHIYFKTCVSSTEENWWTSIRLDGIFGNFWYSKGKGKQRVRYRLAALSPIGTLLKTILSAMGVIKESVLVEIDSS